MFYWAINAINGSWRGTNGLWRACQVQRDTGAILARFRCAAPLRALFVPPMTDVALPAADELKCLLAECLRADRFRLQRGWQHLVASLRGTAAGGRSGKDAGPHTTNRAVAQARWQAQLAASRALRTTRLLSLPLPTFDDALPVCQRREEIRALIAKHQVVIVAGETGSGKTTQLPKILLELGRGVDGYIGHTQPRRLAARAVAARLAQELGTKVGAGVGYQVRFTDEVGPASHIKLMTDGILLAEIPHDRFLEKYDALIIDEAHERSLNIDFLLGYIRRILPKRPDLKVIITSATIDHWRFAQYFADVSGTPAPVIEVSGRTYPVTTIYRPSSEDAEVRVLDLPQAVHQVLGEIVARERSEGVPPVGDVLVFCTGEREIREVHQYLRKAMQGIEVLPLYARLGNAEQNRVFAPAASGGSAGRRVVLATNVAETSITVPNIRYVIDPGFVRISRYSARSRVQRLPIEAISQASANQRQGRCGRIAAGLCYRLYSEADFLARPAYTDAEIQRTNLASVILQMAYLGLGDIEAFEFIDPPDRRFVQDGWRLLEELNAVNAQKVLTALGRQLARLPVDPRLGRILLEAARNGSFAEVLLIVAGLAVQDPRERPHDQQQAADEAHALFADPESDFLWFVNCWRAYEQARQDLSSSDLRRWAERHHLSFLRLREWRETHHQLRLACQQLGLNASSLGQIDSSAAFIAVHRALLSGLLSQIFMREEGREPAEKLYLGTRNRRFALWPGSVLAKKGVQWGVAAELVETHKTFARTVARVQPGWIESQAQHLLRREYFDVQWDGKRGMVMAREQVSLLGLVLHPGRDVHYGPIEPVLARELFIRGALLNGDWGDREPDYSFLAHNQAVAREVDRLESKLRRRDVLVDDAVVYAWFDARLPADIFSTRKFAAWYRQAARGDRSLLCLAAADLMVRTPDELAPDAFPDTTSLAGARVPLVYRFVPGELDDGVSLDVPVAALNQLTATQLDWLVPGLLREQCVALAKSLPKEKRRALVPVPDVIAAVLPRLVPGEHTLVETLASELRRVSRQDIRPEDFNLAALPQHLRVNLRVLDNNGSLLAQGRDLLVLKQSLGAVAVQAIVATGRDTVGTADIRSAGFAPLPALVEAQHAGMTLRSYPALVDEGDRCTVRLYADAATAQVVHRRGLRRLFLLQSAAIIRPLRKALPGFNEAGVHYRSIGTADELLDDLWLAVSDLTFLRDESADDARDSDAFVARWEANRAALHGNANRLVKCVGETLMRAQSVRIALAKMPASLAFTRDDIARQLDALLVPRFVSATPVVWLLELPRYLQAIQLRLEKQSARDTEFTRELSTLWADFLRLRAQLEAAGRQSTELETYRWLIEEYRVSLFAQQLRTRLPVSAQRLAKQRERIG